MTISRIWKLGPSAVAASFLLNCSSTDADGDADAQPPSQAESKVEGPTDVVAQPQSNGPEPETILEVEPPSTVNTTPGGVACASASVESQVLPVTLHFALDRSSSMMEFGFWGPVIEALKAFFVDARSDGLSASLNLFPDLSPDQVDRDLPLTACDVDSYQVADVPVAPLPDTGGFAAFLDAAKVGGGTPTLPAVRGAIEQAEAVLAGEPETRAALVLVTDGYPSEICSGNTVESVASAVAAVATRIPTYVIGVGEALDELNKVAEAGGTETAVLIDEVDLDGTRLRLLERLREIRWKASCDVPVPEPPEGRTFEPSKVSTQIRTELGGLQEVPYEADCATGAGWHYDDVEAPTLISLCEQACQGATQTPSSSLEVVFGCTVNQQIAK